EASNNEERHCQRTTTGSGLREERDFLAIDTLSHRFRSRLDFVRRCRSATTLERRLGGVHPLCLLVYRALDIARIDAFGGEFERTILQCISRKLMGPRIGDACEHTLRYVG